MIPLTAIVSRMRNKADTSVQQKDILSQDGTQYTVALTASPVVSGSEAVYITHQTFTTGVPQYVYEYNSFNTIPGNPLNIEYVIDYNYGELHFLQGSGTVIANTGLVPWAPWNGSTVTTYYSSTKYTDNVISDYVSYAVASVEASLQLGMYVSGVSGVAPYPTRPMTDVVGYLVDQGPYMGANPYIPPYGVTEKFIIVENVEIIQELIARRASLDLAIRERRVGAGGAIKLRDGDTEIDTSVGPKWVALLVEDLEKDYQNLLKWVMHNMIDGYSLRQIDENARGLYSWDLGSRTQIYIEGFATGEQNY